MNRNLPSTSILIVDQDVESGAGLQASLRESFRDVEVCQSLREASDCLSHSSFKLVICDLGLVESNHPDCPLVAGFFAQASPVIFQSSQQHAAVRFQRFSGQSFYCLRKSACNDLVPVVASLALKLDHLRSPAPRLPSLPHFGLPSGTDNAVLVSNIHTMY